MICLTLFSVTSHEGISLKVGGTTANGRVIEDLALCIVGTGTRAGIYALLIFASFIKRTIRANNTFGVAARWRSNVAYATRTDGVTI